MSREDEPPGGSRALCSVLVCVLSEPMGAYVKGQTARGFEWVFGGRGGG